ncbi:MAG: replication initiator protein A [Planctomycetes bacterium]|nr:replication initiator protein A [Planctomycetota bacterium]
MAANDPKRKYQDGRDEMNLADFPISALQRQQPTDAEGRKLDKMVFEASRYDPQLRQRVSQRVTLTTSSSDGLPTPADEHVILALLYTAKHGDNFGSAVVHFSPAQLFEIMGWAPNGRSYERLRGVLRRLKSLTLRYENAWWDPAGRGYEEEVATGIISEYRMARQVSGPRQPGAVPRSWVRWTEQFYESLQKGNIKRLNLEIFFRLRSPTAQRMYRFLDKRFYNAPVFSMDLIEFACGHIGLTETRNVAVLKRRLAPGLKELEDIHFITPAADAERYQKVRPGIWRIQFQEGMKKAEGSRQKAEGSEDTTASGCLLPTAYCLLPSAF